MRSYIVSHNRRSSDVFIKKCSEDLSEPYIVYSSCKHLWITAAGLHSKGEEDPIGPFVVFIKMKNSVRHCRQNTGTQGEYSLFEHVGFWLTKTHFSLSHTFHRPTANRRCSHGMNPRWAARAALLTRQKCEGGHSLVSRTWDILTTCTQMIDR